jgi:putative phosphoesterase
MACIGLISDTHFQERLFALPDNLARVWGAVDLVLHAGDVGDLSVLDQLGQIAPVVAVHGNDEPEVAKRDLPEQQLLVIGGVRVLLWHSHYPDPVEERARRKGNWGPKLDRLAARTREAGAQVLMYGHSHVPAISRHAGVTLFNPGALASGSFFTRQQPQTVGRLRVLAGGAVEVEHLDLATGQVVEMPAPDPAEDFGVLGGRYQSRMIEPVLASELRRIQYEDVRSVLQALIPVYRRCFDSGLILRQDLIDAVRSSDLVSANDREKWLAVQERR